MPDVSETHNVGMAPTENMQALLISKLERLLDFLPMTEEDRVVFRRKMRRRLQFGRSGIDVEIRQRLLPYFRDDILHLQDLIRRDLSMWLA